jgi:hypothetical protein
MMIQRASSFLLVLDLHLRREIAVVFLIPSFKILVILGLLDRLHIRNYGYTD